MRDLRRDRLQLDEAGICCIGAAIVSSVGSVVGGIASASGAGKAADAQKEMYAQTRADLLPYNQQGQTAFSAYNAMGPFSFAPTEAQLEQTPGYKFTLNQGLKSVQNDATARGLGISGAAQKGAAAFATGLADQTYQQQFGNALSTYTTNANKLLSAANLGENAAAQTGNTGAQLAGNEGNALISQGNAISNAVTGGTAPFAYMLMSQNNPLTASTAAGGYVPGGYSGELDGLY